MNGLEQKGIQLPSLNSFGERKNGRLRFIVVDRESCIGVRTCVLLAPGVFQIDEQNLAYVVDPDSESDDAILRAAESCPVLAIKIYEEDGTLIFPK